MSCSKIFFGELPELIYEVLKYFKSDFSTLYSCILVNRLWCRLAIPLLWENPFSYPTKNFNFIEIYLHNLNGDLKTKLNEYLIKEHIFRSNTLFNYPSFIKYLNTWRIISSIKEWSSNALKPEHRNLDPNFGRLIQMSLFKMFIDNEVNLHTLDIDIHLKWNSYYDDILELMSQNPNFIHNVRNLNLYVHNNYSNTLNTIILCHVNFEGIINLDKIFEQLNVLESVHIIYCNFLNASIIQQIISLTKPFKLKSLFISERFKIDELLLLLLQNSGSYLENFGCTFCFNYGFSLKQQIFESIIKYCKKIKFLEFEDQITYPLFDLIENMKQNLSYLSINAFNYSQVSSNNIVCDSFILRNLGQILPFKLEYLKLSLHIETCDFEVFLKNTQDTFIKKLVINNIDGQDILSYIKVYIMKKKRVKYLAIMNPFKSTENYNSNKELFSMKDEESD
ncbi:hypothetical protein GLOIN_2v1777503 [Rhizophagus irregularis DAOM 181602=DAOM 197198]|uniref:F-box domain-containing protein n=1 Tax=Rhizophagus irregularis (strain DAOM 181602 / DAOM 197198 / MUCL 43194) TaxID=747089 RepID=A0A2P4PUY3_RHIID|nr:hypothetical protein GLOIN_2v1777503 [Rhizophagus irregularis DAOM 181602=DAOM 197198]POG69160.1 hypothetical protein GLOIN_2v1777503 [Rhizophagus irregularis DAOM 181602=DAOM 197198]GBC34041.2 hypothetical protein GLOIN_2v1777503 [Rhizophagus irregularis DAOM 181602=DAOM 197198]|eukprot:XP_025176026.1 hypothetical protein GLOIN_2v1777503 [Rhizophagus irregularis DAOM 181602=DAOM 197198]